MSGRFFVARGEYPDSGPVLWCARRAFADGGWTETDDLTAAHAVVSYGSACFESAARGGIFLAPPLSGGEIVEMMNRNDHPRLVVGVAESPDWSPADAARLRSVEVLQLSRVGIDFELAGDMAYSLAVLGRLTDRFQALVKRTPIDGDRPG